MNKHVIDDGLLDDAHAAIQRGATWIAYNEVPYLLEKGDMNFFHTKEEAVGFAFDNHSDRDRYMKPGMTTTSSLLDQGKRKNRASRRDIGEVKLKRIE